MIKRFKRAVVDSFIGAIALGYLLAQAILYFGGIFATPFAGWISRRQYGGLVPHSAPLPGFSLQDAMPDAIRFLVLLLVWFALLWWLYLTPPQKDEIDAQALSNPE
jgi:nitric oxide reductase large subunit